MSNQEFKTFIRSIQRFDGSWIASKIQCRETAKFFISEDGTRFEKVKQEHPQSKDIIAAKRNDGLHNKRDEFLSNLDCDFSIKVVNLSNTTIKIGKVENLMHKHSSSGKISKDNVDKLLELFKELGLE